MTRIVVFSDLHGNTPALRAFLERCDLLAPDLVVNLGDVFSGGVDPAGTRDLLRERRDFVTIRGNHERQLLENDHPRPGGSDWLAAQMLAPQDRTWLQSLPLRVEVAPGVLAFHGSPDDDLTYLLETVDPSAANGLREATDREVAERLGSWATQASVFLCGHTHLQRMRRLPSGAVVVNPGSLGWPAYEDYTPLPHRVESGDPRAHFAVLDCADAEPSGWRVTLCAIDYDVDVAVAMAQEHHRPDVAVALGTGYTGR